LEFLGSSGRIIVCGDTFVCVRVCVVFIVCNVSFIVCVALCAVFCLSVVCYGLTVVSLPQVKTNLQSDNNNNNNNNLALSCDTD
jgi:hypothetical protein